MSGARIGSDCSRRQFISRCAACAGCAAGAMLAGASGARAEAPAAKAKVRLVFCETKNDHPIWPNIGYDFDARRARILDVLAKGCPGVEFVQARLMDNPAEAAEVLKGDAEVGGYLVCLQGLGWRNDVVKLCGTGKPTLVVDNLFGGSGLFLTRMPQFMGAGRPVDWVSSSRDEDLAASARHFAMLRDGKSPAEIAAAFRATRRGATPAVADWTCAADPVPAPDLGKALEELKKTKLLIVGGRKGRDPFFKATAEVTGVEFVGVPFEEMSAACAAADAGAARAFAERWAAGAKKVVEPSPEDLRGAGTMYVAMKALLERHGARGISVNCLGGFYGGHLTAYPCLGFSQLNDDGFVGGCEADALSALTMAVMGAVTGRPGYISDPVIDTSKSAIVYAHCVAMTKPFGPGGPASPYFIRSHSEDRKGACVQSILPVGHMTTTLEISPQAKQVLVHRAKTIGNNDSDLACRTKLEAQVKGSLEKLTEEWRPGWHRVTFYGDLSPHVDALCDRWKLQRIDEA
ncbi:MAG: hypothetical protein FJ221_06960 [Lentisphaerae bacterium]|nr:hypothetical protein [Lentisphaerota bacterium]